MAAPLENPDAFVKLICDSVAIANAKAMESAKREMVDDIIASLGHLFEKHFGDMILTSKETKCNFAVVQELLQDVKTTFNVCPTSTGTKRAAGSTKSPPNAPAIFKTMYIEDATYRAKYRTDAIVEEIIRLNITKNKVGDDKFRSEAHHIWKALSDDVKNEIKVFQKMAHTQQTIENDPDPLNVDTVADDLTDDLAALVAS
jgi:hypothetical protein